MLMVPQTPFVDNHCVDSLKNGPPARGNLKAGGLYTSRSVTAATSLLIHIGFIPAKDRKNRPLLSIPLWDNERQRRSHFLLSDTEYDVRLIDPKCHSLPPHHRHLAPLLHTSTCREKTNCHFIFADLGHSVLIANRDLPEDTWFIAYVPSDVIVKTDSPHPSPEAENLVPLKAVQPKPYYAAPSRSNRLKAKSREIFLSQDDPHTVSIDILPAKALPTLKSKPIWLVDP